MTSRTATTSEFGAVRTVVAVDGCIGDPQQETEPGRGAQVGAATG
jgi:hypothetical protein